MAKKKRDCVNRHDPVREVMMIRRRRGSNAGRLTHGRISRLKYASAVRLAADQLAMPDEGDAA
jgi:hypothetical protein